MENKEKLKGFIHDLKSNNNYENRDNIELVESENVISLNSNFLILNRHNHTGIVDYDYKRLYDDLIEKILNSLKNK